MCVYIRQSRKFASLFLLFFSLLFSSVWCVQVLVQCMLQNYILETHLTVLAIREPKPRSDSALVPRPEVLLTDSFLLRYLVCEVFRLGFCLNGYSKIW